MSLQEANFEKLRKSPTSWLVTGAAGFIGSHLVENLLLLGQRVVCIDNFSTGKEENLSQLRKHVGEDLWQNCSLLKGDLADKEILHTACHEVEYILHHAAVGSVPLSLKNPLLTHASNVSGFVNLLDAARIAGIRRVIYASSSAVYGDCPHLPLKEVSAGEVLSPYAASKWIDEVYARTYAICYGMQLVGLRYFNVFGPRQDPAGAYAAVIPKWINAFTSGKKIIINGDGANTRDFCFIHDVVRANLLAASAQISSGTSLALNVGTGHAVSLLQLFETLNSVALEYGFGDEGASPLFGAPRPGDIIHSTADISAATEKINFTSAASLESSLKITFQWFHGQSVTASLT